MLKFIILLLSEILLIILLLQGPPHIVREEALRAAAAYHKNPAPETQREHERQKHITASYRFAVTAGIALLLGLNSYALVRVYRKQRKGNVPEDQRGPQ